MKNYNKHIYKFWIKCTNYNGFVLEKGTAYAYAEDEETAKNMVIEDCYNEYNKFIDVEFTECCGIDDSAIDLWDLVIKSPEDYFL